MTAGGASLRSWWAGLGVKLFGSYLIVVAIGIGTLVVAAGLATPSIFDLHMAQMMGNTGPGRGSGMGMGMGQVIAGAGNSQVASQLDAALADAFRASLGQGLLVAGAAAVVTAIGASLLVSHRIASPVITLARASHRIAEGHYCA